MSGPRVRAAAAACVVSALVQQVLDRPALGARIRGYVALTKPRIIELLLVTTVPTMVVAERGLPPFWLMFWTVAGGTLAAGGANAINMYVDRDIDAIMKRTQGRPLVTGVLTPPQALRFAITMSVARDTGASMTRPQGGPVVPGVLPPPQALRFAIGIEIAAFLLLWGTVNLLSGILAVAACLFYVFVYTLWLKRSSTQNIVIGGAAGAVPVLVGWSAVTNSLSWAPIVLFAIIFYWTPPHFWALAVKYKDDYSAANVPMLPSVASMRVTAERIVGYTLFLWGLTLVFGPVAHMGAIYLVAATVLGGVFTWFALRLLRSESTADAMRVFGWSITYVTLLFGAMAADQLVRSGL